MKYLTFSILLLILNISPLCAQDQLKIESLTEELSVVNTDIERIDLYNKISNEYRRTDSLNTAIFANKAYDLSVKINYPEGISDAYRNFASAAKYSGHYLKASEWFKKSLDSAPSDDLERKGEAINGLASISRRQGNYPQAIEYYLQNLDNYESINDQQGLSRTYNNMGVTYEVLGDNNKALENFEMALKLKLELDDQLGIARNYNNLGNMYLVLGQHDKALKNFNNSMEIQRERGDEQGLAVSYVNMGAVYEKENMLAKAIENYHLGLDIFIKNKTDRHRVETLNLLSSAYAKSGEVAPAISYAKEAYELATESGDVKNIKKSSKELHTLYSRIGNYKAAYEKILIFKEMSDSITNENNIEEMTKLVMQHSFDREKDQIEAENEKKEAIKDLEIQKQNADLAKQRLGLLAAGGGLFLLILLAFSIRRGKKRSDELLHNILPEKVAVELKQNGKALAKKFDHVTVLFTDFKGFTTIAEQLSPKELVNDLNLCFSEFDKITSKYGIEKIKTIGDAYMAAGGLPVPNQTHAKDVINAALEIRGFIEDGKARRISAGLPYFDIRVGIHTGPVVAGIVGLKKFSYDIWGDTVNIASRMESSGEVGQVNISHTTYELLKNDARFSFASRGKIEAKGKGKMEMYFVSKA